MPRRSPPRWEGDPPRRVGYVVTRQPLTGHEQLRAQGAVPSIEQVLGQGVAASIADRLLTRRRLLPDVDVVAEGGYERVRAAVPESAGWQDAVPKRAPSHDLPSPHPGHGHDGHTLRGNRHDRRGPHRRALRLASRHPEGHSPARRGYPFCRCIHLGLPGRRSKHPCAVGQLLPLRGRT